MTSWNSLSSSEEESSKHIGSTLRQSLYIYIIFKHLAPSATEILVIAGVPAQQTKLTIQASETTAFLKKDSLGVH